MNNTIIYKNECYSIRMILESINEKLCNLISDKKECMKYRLALYLENNQSIDIYLSEDDKAVLTGTINNIRNNKIKEADLNFSNTVLKQKIYFYKIYNYIRDNTIHKILPFVYINLKLKIYKEKNFVVINPEIYYSFLLGIKKHNIKLLPILLFKDTII